MGGQQTGTNDLRLEPFTARIQNVPSPLAVDYAAYRDGMLITSSFFPPSAELIGPSSRASHAS